MFYKCTTEKEAKDLYKKLAKHLHPDAGGDNDLMCLLTDAYEYKIKEMIRSKCSSSQQICDEYFQGFAYKSTRENSRRPQENYETDRRSRAEAAEKFKKRTKKAKKKQEKRFYQAREEICRIELGDPDLQILGDMLKYHDKNDHLDRTYLDSIYAFFVKYNFISSVQYNKLVSLYHLREMGGEA